MGNTWKNQLQNMLDNVGSEPSFEESEAISDFVLNQVPREAWASVALYLPGDLCSEFMERSVEWGI